MSTIYLVLVVCLFVLAVFDLSVGVSNDAVNFLNSAIGAKVATFRTILLVAAIGIFAGAAMSNGMMDIARHGIFRPSMFSFNELIFIFVAVMASDIVLLDIFNSMGMPTSTTISMVFELLGGSCALSFIKILKDETLTLGQLINSDKALQVIIAIFFSVAVAFIFGVLIQWLSRLLFTFSYKNSGLKWKIGIFGGLAATALLYFMLIKGIGSSQYMPAQAISWIDAHIWQLILLCLVFCTILMEVLYFLKVNVFKVLVLMGTFGLAWAFAGNDLVNFIGVPLAGYSSFVDFQANGGGTDAAHYMMTSLEGPAKTPTFFLVGAGIIMVIALATSKKAQNVVKTSVDLSRQSGDDEMFGSSRIARVLVRATRVFSGQFSSAVPVKARAWASSRFEGYDRKLPNGAAFDEVRATVNLVVGSLLIALGTSFKLPLSTTYVTFMVAMGSSLADKAWGRDSAVFRITGVVSVIGGWFITAAAAFILCFIVATLMYAGGIPLTVIMIAFAFFLLVRSNIRYKKRAAESGDVIYDKILKTQDQKEVLELVIEHITWSDRNFLLFIDEQYMKMTDGFMEEKLSELESASRKLRDKREDLKAARRKEMVAFRRVDPDVAIGKTTWFHLDRNSCEDLLYSMRRICDSCMEHVDNNFTPMSEEMKKEFTPMRDTVRFLLKRSSDLIGRGSDQELEDLSAETNQFEYYLSDARKRQMVNMQRTKENLTIAYVYLNLLQETEVIVNSLRHMLRACNHLRNDDLPAPEDEVVYIQ